MDQRELALSIAAVMPEEGAPVDELVALGMVVAGVIATTNEESRAELVNRFCETLRQNVASQLN